jgi:HSP20 family protein
MASRSANGCGAAAQEKLRAAGKCVVRVSGRFSRHVRPALPSTVVLANGSCNPGTLERHTRCHFQPRMPHTPRLSHHHETMIAKQESIEMLPTVWNRSGAFTIGRLTDLQREFDRVFQAFDGQTNDASWVPAMDVVETKDAVEVRLEVPGLQPNDIDVRVDDNVLTIAGEKKSEKKNESASDETAYRHVERRYGQFRRTFKLPTSTDATQVAANYNNGVLTITLPKAERAKPRKIEIKNA